MTVGELLAKLGADFSQFNKDLAKAEGMARKSGATIGDVFKNAFSVTLGIGFFQAVQQGFRSVVGEAVNFNSMMEQAQIGFTTMLGSAERAQAFLDEMADFAAKTPFEYPDLLDAAKRMMAMGFAAEEVLPTLRAIGDAAAGLGLGREGINRITLALGRMRAKAKVSGEEMRQLTEAGVPAWEMLAEAMGKSTAEVMKMSEKGLILANKAIQILIEGMEKRFPNMMENMENTWQGVTSTIRDVWRMTIGALTSNLFKGLVQWLQGVRDWATEFYNTFRQFGLQAALTKSFGPEFAASVNIAVTALRGLWNTARTILSGIAKYWAIIKPLAISAAIAFLTFKTVNWVLKQTAFIMAVLKGEAIATSGIFSFAARAVQIYQLQLKLASMAGIAHVGVLQVLRTALYSVWAAMGPLGWAIMGVSAAVMAGITLWSKYAASVEQANLQRVLQAVSGQNANVADSSQQAAQGLENQADATKEAGKAADKNIQSFDEVHQIMEDTAGAAEDITAGLDQVAMPTLEAPGAMALPGLDTSALEQAKPTLAGFWDWIKRGFVNAWDSIKNAVVGAWNWIVAKTRPVWEPVANFFKGLWNGIKTVAVAAWEGIGSILSTTWQSIINIGIGLWKVFSSALWQIWNALQVAAQTIWNAVKTFLSTVWNNTLLLASTIWQAIRDLILGKIDLRTAISTIWGAIKAFLTSNWNAVKTLANTIWSAISQFIIAQWDLLSTTAVTIWNAVAEFFAVTWNTIKEVASQAWEIIKINLLTVWEVLKGAAITAWEAIKTAILTPVNYVKGELDKAWGWIKEKTVTAWEAIKHAAQEKWNGVRDVIKGAINGIIGMINKFIRAFNRIEIRVPSISIPFVGTVGGWTVRVPQIPEIPLLDVGGIVQGPGLFAVGPGVTEAVVPLGRSGFADDMATTVAQAVYAAIRDAFRVIQAEGATQKEIILEIDGKRIARAVIPSIISEEQRLGTALRGV